MFTNWLHQAILVRTLSIALAIGLAFVVSPQLLFLIVVILGHGHFMLAYIYQAEGGHLKSRKMLILVGCMLALSWLSLLISITLFAFITGFITLLHHAVDEIRFMNVKHSLYTTLESLPFIFVYTSIFADASFHSSTFWFANVLVLAVIVVYATLCVRTKRSPNVSSYASLVWLCITLAASVFYQLHPSYANAWLWFDALVLVHYFTWYGFYWFKLMNKTFVQTEYVLRAAIINIVFLILGVLWLTGGVPILGVLFAPAAFLAWSLLHCIGTYRNYEWATSLKL